MSEVASALAVRDWYRGQVEDFLRRESAEKLVEFEPQLARLDRLISERAEPLAICFLGQAGVGKSTLINTLVGGAQYILPAGGVGTLTAQATLVKYASVPYFRVEYQPTAALNQLVFGLEQNHEKELRRRGMIRPYRLGPIDEPATRLYDRIAKEIGRQASDDDVDDIEEVGPADGWRPDPKALAALLTEGAALLREVGDEKWRLLEERVLALAGTDKVVLFAQPIETVTALARYLERRYGQRPALIIGNQSEEDRTREVNAFWRSDGPRFLVSSKAGGEGINLQCAFRLVHVDVPWNPMDLEQRIGRVHRFGSRRTIVVDTVVVKNSREVDAYAIAHRKLQEVASTMVPPDRFDALFARVMALVPPEEMLQILSERALSPLSSNEQDRIRELVTRGFATWNEFHRRYSDGQREIRNLAPGTAGWDDVARLVREQLRGVAVDGYTGLSFRRQDGDIVEQRQAAAVYRLSDGNCYACDDYAGMPVTDAAGNRAVQIGLNVPIAAAVVRELAFPLQASGGAHLRANGPLPACLPATRPFGLLAFARQTLQVMNGAFVEAGLSLHLFVVAESGAVPIAEEQKGSVVRFLKDCVVRREVNSPGALERTLAEQETRLTNELRRPDDSDRVAKRLHAIVPLFAAVVA